MSINFNNPLTERLYQDFCEAEGGVDHPIFQVWIACEKQFGEISNEGSTSCVNNLFLETIRYVIDTLHVVD